MLARSLADVLLCVQEDVYLGSLNTLDRLIATQSPHVDVNIIYARSTTTHAMAAIMLSWRKGCVPDKRPVVRFVCRRLRRLA